MITIKHFLTYEILEILRAEILVGTQNFDFKFKMSKSALITKLFKI
jgi:hypothetical protein